MFFYPYNYGLDPWDVKILHMDNHVGDIETMGITFKQEQPTKIFYATHDWGEHYKWDDEEIEKEDGHPIGYIARGSHATYTKEGKHKFILDIVTDHTAKKVKWNTDENI